MIRPDPRDPNCPPVPWNGPDLGKPTVAVTKQTAGYPMHPGIGALIDRAADQLAAAGYTVVEADPPPVADAAAGWFTAGSTEMKSMLDGPLRTYGSPTIVEIFDWYYEMSTLLDLDGYLATVAARTGLMRDWNVFLDRHPLLLCPFMMRPMYDWDYDAQSLDNVRDLFTSAIYSTGINYLGLPAGVIGMDLVEDRPAAIQIVGRRFREDVICDALEAIETANGVLTHRLWDR
jgi:amidase